MVPTMADPHGRNVLARDCGGRFDNAAGALFMGEWRVESVRSWFGASAQRDLGTEIRSCV
jgi:hypothetical protein